MMNHPDPSRSEPQQPSLQDIDPLPELMLPGEVAEYFRVTPYTLAAWLRKGAFPGAFKVGGSWRIHRDEVRAYAKSLAGDRTGKRAFKAGSPQKRK